MIKFVSKESVFLKTFALLRRILNGRLSNAIQTKGQQLSNVLSSIIFELLIQKSAESQPMERKGILSEVAKPVWKKTLSTTLTSHAMKSLSSAKEKRNVMENIVPALIALRTVTALMIGKPVSEKNVLTDVRS